MHMVRTQLYTYKYIRHTQSHILNEFDDFMILFWTDWSWEFMWIVFLYSMNEWMEQSCNSYRKRQSDVTVCSNDVSANNNTDKWVNTLYSFAHLFFFCDFTHPHFIAHKQLQQCQWPYEKKSARPKCTRIVTIHTRSQSPLLSKENYSYSSKSM